MNAGSPEPRPRVTSWSGSSRPSSPLLPPPQLCSQSFSIKVSLVARGLSWRMCGEEGTGRGGAGAAPVRALSRVGVSGSPWASSLWVSGPASGLLPAARPPDVPGLGSACLGLAPWTSPPFPLRVISVFSPDSLRCGVSCGCNPHLRPGPLQQQPVTSFRSSVRPPSPPGAPGQASLLRRLSILDVSQGCLEAAFPAPVLLWL